MVHKVANKPNIREVLENEGILLKREDTSFGACVRFIRRRKLLFAYTPIRSALYAGDVAPRVMS